MNSHYFEDLGVELIGPSYKNANEKNKLRKYKCFFGATPKIVGILWQYLLDSGWFKYAPAKKVKPLHLLMGLYFLKCYNVETVNASFFGCSEKTFRQWSWYILRGIAKLDKKLVS